ncbi:hypothetical protein LCGC14_2252590, partial [marine sediment metagenome]
MGICDPFARRDRRPAVDGGRGGAAVLEPLESRVMLNADLTGTVAVTDVTYATQSGAVIVDMQRNADPAAGLESYTISLVSTDDTSVVTAFTGRLDGPMNQVWWFDSVQTPTMDLLNEGRLTPAEAALDTHLLLATDQLLIPPGNATRSYNPREDRDPGTGLGSWMAWSETYDMTFAFNPSQMANRIEFAQVVVPAGQQVHMRAEVSYRRADNTHDFVVLDTWTPESAEFDADYVVRNAGTSDAGAFWVDLYLSKDTSFGDPSDVLLDHVRMPALQAGQSIGGTFTNQSVQGYGDWYLGMVVDPGGEEAESNEGNNQLHDAITQTTPSISITDVQVAEGDSGSTSAVFEVSLSAATAATVRVDFAAADGTAQSDDYTPATGTLTFLPGETVQTVTVLVDGDTDIEQDETFVVDLSNPAGATIADAQALGTITNDDMPTITVDDVQVTEGDVGTIDA